MKGTALLLTGCISLACLVSLAPASVAAHRAASFTPTIGAVTPTGIISRTIPQDGGGWPPCCRLISNNQNWHPMPELLADGGGWPPCCRAGSTGGRGAIGKPFAKDFKG